MSAEVTYWGAQLWVCPRCQGHGHIVLTGGPGWIPEGRPEDVPIFSKHQALKMLFDMRDQGMITSDVAQDCGVSVLQSDLPDHVPGDISEIIDGYETAELRLERCRQGRSDLGDIELDGPDLSERVHSFLVTKSGHGVQ